MTDEAGPAFAFFAVAMTVMGFANFVLLFGSRDAAFKRRLQPRLAILGALLFSGLLWSAGVPGPAVALATAFGAVASYVGMRRMRFCDGCGRTVLESIPWSRAQYCATCGARLS